MIFNFYATEGDLIALFRWMDAAGEFQFIEEYSQLDKENRIFEYFPETEWLGEQRLDYVSIWPILAGAPPRPRRISFDRETRSRIKGKYRTILESPSIIKFNRCKMVAASYIGPVEFHYNTEKMIRNLSEFDIKQINQIQWSIFNNIISTIKNRLKSTAVAKWRSMPVMSDAASHLDDPSKKLWFWGKEGTI